MILPRFYSRLAKTVTVSLILQLCFASVGFAKTSTRLTAALPNETVTSPVDQPDKAAIDQFKADLAENLKDIEEVTDIALESDFGRGLIESANLDPKGAIGRMKDKLATLSDEGALRLKNAYEKSNPNWKESGKKLKGLYTDGVRNRLKSLPPKPGHPKNQNASLTSATSMPTLASIFNNKKPVKFNFSKYSQRLSAYARNSAVLMTMPGVDPQTCDPGPGTPMGITDVIIAKGVVIAAEGVMEALPTDGLTIEFREIPLAAYIAAEAAELVLEGLNEVEAECEDAKFQFDVTNKLNNLQTSVDKIIPNDNANRDTILHKLDENTTIITNKIDDSTTFIVNNDNKNKTEIINNDNANRDFLLRTQIEADLAQNEGATPVALYELPASQEGYLELARTIVQQTIARVKAAGMTTGVAQNFFNTADAYKAAGNFKAAYDNYRKAYRAAAK